MQTVYRRCCGIDIHKKGNRLEKTLEGTNIKLSSLVSDLTGVSSGKMLHKCRLVKLMKQEID